MITINVLRIIVAVLVFLLFHVLYIYYIMDKCFCAANKSLGGFMSVCI